MRFLVTMLFVVAPLCAQGGPKNLKVLSPDDLRSGVMMKYTAALGVKCDFCHVPSPGGKDSDDNPKKNVARMMITMAKDINSKIASASGGTAKEYVTCYTCHRGKNEPETAPAAGLPLP